MGSCTRRHFLLSTCFLQMITIIERQVFDFLGYMWAPIFVNFFHIIFVIFGFYGAYHFRIKYIITYLIWNFLWIGWNSFLICFYLNVGVLDRDSDLLNLGTGSFSWFEVNGYGCKPIYPTNITSDDPFRPLRPERVDECLLDYEIVEIIHSGVQCALALLGIFGAIFISYIFLDEDDRFDFMNGDAKSPQHTVVHPMYVSYSSIPTSASATMLSNKHHNHHNNYHHQQQNSQHYQQTNNNNTFLIHTNSSNSNSLSNLRSSIKKSNSNNNNNNTPNASKNNTLTRMLYNQKNNKIASSTTSIMQTTTATATASTTPTATFAQKYKQQPQYFQQMQQQKQQYYDDSTAKADQLYTNSNRRQVLAIANTNPQPPYVPTPGSSSHENTTSSLSYASLQNSNLNLRGVGGGGTGTISGTRPGTGLGGSIGIHSPLSNSNYSLANSINNNNNNSSSGHFARIHPKPKPPKSVSYSSFINGGSTCGSGSTSHRPDIKYTQMSTERLSNNFEEEGFDDDNFSLQNFKTDDTITYVPFKRPTPGGLLLGQNNNPSYTSLNSFSPNQNSLNNNASPNNNNNNNINHKPFVRENSLTNGNEILLENGAVLQPHNSQQQPQQPLTQDFRQYQLSMQQPATQQQQPILSRANRFIYQQNGLPFHPAYSPTPFRADLTRLSTAFHQPTRPTNIPLPTIPIHGYNSSISPSEVTPPPPPAPRPHIFQPRSGHAPYPDISPEVAEKYSMPTQYVPRSPVASRIARRQRQQHERSHLANTAANFCDQIRDAPPGYIDTGFNIVRARSFDRLSSNQSASLRESKSPANGSTKEKDSAPRVNRRSGRREQKARPRSYCNSMIGGEGVIRTNLAPDRGGMGGVGVGNGSKISANFMV